MKHRDSAWFLHEDDDFSGLDWVHQREAAAAAAERKKAIEAGEVEPDPPLVNFIIGLDLGQAADYTALALLERQEVRPNPPTYDLRELKQYPLKTAYTEIVASVARLMRRPELGREPYLVVDATGVGRPVIDLLRAAGLDPVPVVITAGIEESNEGLYYHTPKADLVTGTEVLLQAKRLRVAGSLPLASVLITELTAFKRKATLAGNEVFGAWREGEHDDLVLAVALAAWYGERRMVAGSWV